MPLLEYDLERAEEIRSNLEAITSLFNKKSIKKISLTQLKTLLDQHECLRDVIDVSECEDTQQMFTCDQLIGMVLDNWFGSVALELSRQPEHSRILGKGFHEAGFYPFAGEVSSAMHVASVTSFDNNSPIWKTFFNPNEKKHATGMHACPMIRNLNGAYEFIHPCLLGYFANKHHEYLNSIEITRAINTNKNYALLENYCMTNQLRVIWELSLPRSNSTAWQIAIAQAKNTMQINEPSFHEDFKSRRCDGEPIQGTRSFDEYCRKIVLCLNGDDKVKPDILQSQQRAWTAADPFKQQQPALNLIVNDLTHSVSLNETRLMLHISKDICVTIRDPFRQAHSALTRCINDGLSKPGGDVITAKQALALANKTFFSAEEISHLQVSGAINSKHLLAGLGFDENKSLTNELLLRSIANAVQRCCQDYIEICWENLRKQLELIRATPNVNLVVIDGDDLLQDPETVMRRSCEAFDLEYTENMVHHWEKSRGEKFNCSITENWPRDLAMNNAWNGPARNSTKIERKPNAISDKVSLTSFPQSMHANLEKAQEFYENIGLLDEKIKLVKDEALHQSAMSKTN